MIDTAAEDSPSGTGDAVYGDEGNDTINVWESAPTNPRDADTVYCGPGRKDRVSYNGGWDVVAKDCEKRRPG